MKKLAIFIILACIISLLFLFLFPLIFPFPPVIPEKVSVIYLQGILLSGQIPEDYGYASSEEIIKKLRDAEEDVSTKAIVLRINSPGGSPAASQEIVKEIKKLTKPVVVSMGDIAASGAYYVAVAADRIFASPDTMTGSIGAIWIFENKSGYYEEEGINFTVVKSGEYKDMGANWRGPTENETEYAEEVIQELHERFVKEIAEGRNLSMDYVRNLSDGRIIMGEEAKELGLIDEIGNLYDAIDEASRLGGIVGKPEIEYMREEMDISSILKYWEESPYGRMVTFNSLKYRE
jgi:protease-4